MFWIVANAQWAIPGNKGTFFLYKWLIFYVPTQNMRFLKKIEKNLPW